jgi:hypothetical protein
MLVSLYGVDSYYSYMAVWSANRNKLLESEDMTWRAVNVLVYVNGFDQA